MLPRGNQPEYLYHIKNQIMNRNEIISSIVSLDGDVDYKQLANMTDKELVGELCLSVRPYLASKKSLTQ
jgi:hypothetical protein